MIILVYINDGFLCSVYVATKENVVDVVRKEFKDEIAFGEFPKDWEEMAKDLEYIETNSGWIKGIIHFVEV